MFLYLTAALISLLISLRAIYTRSMPQLALRNISYGEITRQAFTEGDLLETDAEWNPECHAVSVNIRYATGIDTAGKGLQLEVLSAADETVYSGVSYLENAGFVGDDNDEGYLLFEFPATLQGTFTLRFSPFNITDSDAFQIALRTSSSYLSDTCLNGQPLENQYFMGNVYLSGNTTSVNDSVLTAAILQILLFAFLFPFEQRQKTKLTLPVPVFDRKFLVSLVFLLAAEGVLFEYGYYRIQDGTEFITDINTRSGKYITIEPGEELEWTICSTVREFNGIGLYVTSSYDPDLRLLLQIKDSDGTIAAEEELNMDSLVDKRASEDKRFFFANIYDSEYKEYTVSLSYLDGSSSLKLRASTDTGIPYTRSIHQIYTTIQKFYFLICGILLLGSIVLLCAYFAKASFRQCFIIAAVPLLLAMGLLNKPMTVPDEYAHNDTAYRISNEIMGISSPYYDYVYKRECDVLADPLASISFAGESFRRMSAERELTGHRHDEYVPVYARDLRSDSCGIFYVPAAAGITLARMIGMGKSMTLYMARFGNLFAAFLILMIILKAVPEQQLMYAVLAFLPMSLKQMFSVSPDALIFPLCFLITAINWKLLTKKQLSRRELVILIVTSLTLSLAKGGAYVPMLLFTFFSIMSVYRAYLFASKRSVLLFVCGGTVLLLVFLFRWGPTILNRINVDAIDAYSSRLSKWHYSAAYLISHPVLTFRIIEGTFYRTIPNVITSFFGSGLGWMNTISFNPAAQYGLMFVTVIAALQKTEGKISGKHRFLFVLTFLLVVGAFSFAMLTGWTSLGLDYVNGLSSRYYFPLLPLLIMTVNNDKIAVSIKDEAFMLLCQYGLLLFGIVSACISAWG